MAYGSPIGIDPEGIRDGFGSSTFGIEIDEWTDFPSFAELIGRMNCHGQNQDRDRG
ncbi:MAG: hypothetical protein V8S08_05530 [Lachnoclostridium sp.]